MEQKVVIDGLELNFFLQDDGVFHSLDQRVIAAKQIERKLVYQAFHEAFLEELKRIKLQTNEKALFVELLAKFQDACPDFPCRSNILFCKIKRKIERIAAVSRQKLSDIDIEHLCKKIVDAFHKNQKAEISSALEASGILLEKSKENNFLSKVWQNWKLAHDEKAFQKEYEAFCHSSLSVAKRLQDKVDTVTDHGKRNKQILKALRAALMHPIYLFLKEDEMHTIVHFLHTLCITSFSEPSLLDAFLPIGEHIGHLTSKELKQSGNTTINFHRFLQASRVTCHNHGLIKNDRGPKYFLKFSKYIFEAFLSTKLGARFCKFKKYDPKIHLENNAGAFFEEKLLFLRSKKACFARTVFTPTPTIGAIIAQEALGLLQALENRHFLTAAQLRNEPQRYLCLIYTNLQNISSEHEHERSLALMRLNEKFPFSFFGITVSQDSAFYRSGILEKNERHIRKIIQGGAHSPLDLQYRDQMKDLVTFECNFSLKARKTNPHASYYFPIYDKDNKQSCKADLQYIVDQAYHVVEEKQKPTSITCISDSEWNWYKKAAFRELTTLGIIKYFQNYAMKKLAAKQQNSEEIQLLMTNACKENIDRGGKINTELYWAMAGRHSKTLKGALSSFHSRALLARRRLILPNRIEAIYALTMVLSQEEAQTFLHEIGKKEGVVLDTLTPIIKHSFLDEESRNNVKQIF